LIAGTIPIAAFGLRLGEPTLPGRPLALDLLSRAPSRRENLFVGRGSVGHVTSCFGDASVGSPSATLPGSGSMSRTLDMASSRSERVSAAARRPKPPCE